jgi:hypothetical protein
MMIGGDPRRLLLRQGPHALASWAEATQQGIHCDRDDAQDADLA